MRPYIRNKAISVVMIAVFIVSVFAGTAFAGTGVWKCDSKGWWYEIDGLYYKSKWAEIDGEWYYFDSHGYMEHDCYRDGYWLRSNGSWDKAYSHGTWKNNSKGWWYEDNGWYPSNKWLWIDGCRYYFNSEGYMEHDCYRDGCWLRSNGSWDQNYSKGTWKRNAQGYWYEDNGWYPKDKWLWIDGNRYHFDEDGYMESDCYRDGCWLMSDGAWDTAFSHGEWKHDYIDNVLRYWYDDNGWKPVNKALVIDGMIYWFDENGYRTYSGKNPKLTRATNYSYEIIPLVTPLNTYFYIKTDNPDPNSFRFYDYSTGYNWDNQHLPTIIVSKSLYADVVYENRSIYRVKGGYIACGYSGNVDGGELVLQEYQVVGGSLYKLFYDYRDTSVTVNAPELECVTDYLIDTYGDPNKGFHENMAAIQDGMNEICLYNGVAVLGDVKKAQARKYVGNEYFDSECFSGICMSPHNDGAIMVTSPYYRADNRSMLLGSLYPFILQSTSFPATLATVAYKLAPDAVCKKDSYYHYLINVTYDGVTKSYGGAGTGGGQGIYESNIAYYFRFDGSDSDALNRCNLKTLKKDIEYYGTLEIDNSIDQDPLDFTGLINSAGPSGTYIRVNASKYSTTSNGVRYYNVNEGFCYVCQTGSGDTASLSFMSYTWYDGRFFNIRELFVPGADFEYSITSAEVPSLTFKDAVIPIPDNGKYKYSGYTLSSKGYDFSTGVWPGLSEYKYDSASQTWINPILHSINYYDADQRKTIYLKNDPEYGPAFVDACTITMEEARAMSIDKNTNSTPSEYYIYDMTEKPGTYYKEG